MQRTPHPTAGCLQRLLLLLSGCRRVISPAVIQPLHHQPTSAIGQPPSAIVSPWGDCYALSSSIFYPPANNHRHLCFPSPTTVCSVTNVFTSLLRSAVPFATSLVSPPYSLISPSNAITCCQRHLAAITISVANFQSWQQVPLPSNSNTGVPLLAFLSVFFVVTKMQTYFCQVLTLTFTLMKSQCLSFPYSP